MRLVDLNLWWGDIHEPLLAFIKEQAPTADIFCFQEMVAWSRENNSSTRDEVLYGEIQSLLPDFNSSFVAMQDFPDALRGPNRCLGLAIFVRKTAAVADFGSFFAYGARSEFDPNDVKKMPGTVQYARLSAGGREYTIANFHGLAVWPKTDTPERLEQSRTIANFLAGIRSPKILCGDFNLFPDTKSIALLEEGMTNLVKKYRVPLTRSRLFYLGEDKISDYILISPDISVQDFSVPDVAVSDHLPLILDFS
ncbi:MAG: endonuclease/exonuclease/phosphatase family protein [Candidatus Jorgensenbacteria bacterium]